jgi:hypothetical protein
VGLSKPSPIPGGDFASIERSAAPGALQEALTERACGRISTACGTEISVAALRASVGKVGLTSASAIGPVLDGCEDSSLVRTCCRIRAPNRMSPAGIRLGCPTASAAVLLACGSRSGAATECKADSSVADTARSLPIEPEEDETVLTFLWFLRARSRSGTSHR